MNIIDRCIIYYLIRKGNFDEKRARYYLEHMKEDWKDDKISFKTKLWATRRGFYPSRVDFLGLSELNCKDYLSDYQYRRCHPLNNHFAFWINDKLTLKYMFQSISCKDPKTGKECSLLPKYYLYVENDGHYSYLMDCPNSIEKNEDFIINLLKQVGILALKPSNGQGGQGFIRLEYVDGDILCNSKLLQEGEFLKLLSSINGYIVTEYVKQHSELNKVWPGSECTLRIIALKVNNETTKYLGGGVHILCSYARFGTNKSGGASNLSSGGVAVKFDFNSGIIQPYFYQKKQFSSNGEMILEKHPDTGVILEGQILPHWEMIKDAVFDMCNYLSSLEYFGFDFFITEEGIKLCEINSLPALDIEQIMYGPLLKDKVFKDFLCKKTK